MRLRPAGVLAYSLAPVSTNGGHAQKRRKYPINSIRVRSPRTRISSNTKLDSLTNNKDSVSVTFQYMDGLGRPVQTVQQQDSPSGNDIVQPIVYDQYGRDTVKYLPYTVSASVPGAYQPTVINLTESDEPLYTLTA